VRPTLLTTLRAQPVRRATMSHIPVNHPLRPLYRLLVASVGLYVLAFGVIGAIRTAGSQFFDRTEVSVLGLRTNLAFALLSILSGVVILVALFVSRNIDAGVNLWGGVGFMVVGTAMLAVIVTDLNVLNFDIVTVIVSFSIGLLLFTAGLYGRTASVKSA
jgi:hypothetical protein